MPTPFRNLVPSFAATALVAAVLVACAPARLQVPGGFAERATGFPASGISPRRFNEPVRIGPYSALEMREGSTFSWSIPVAGLDVGAANRPYAFTLVASGEPPVPVQCRSRQWRAGFGASSRRSVVDATRLAGPLLACGLRFDDGPAHALEVAASGARLQGRLASPWRNYALRSLHGFAGSPLPSSTASGFEILHDGRTVAVVDALNGGRVLFDTAVAGEERAYLAAASVALLLLDIEALEEHG